MQLADKPNQLVLPFANNVTGRNAIPVTTLTPGAASLTEGFPALTRTPLGSGGVPPDGLDMNGILYLLSALTRWQGAGAGFPYDNTFATDPDVNGYPKGALVLASDSKGYWLNTTDNNATDPEAGGAGWVLYAQRDLETVAMSAANVTLTALQYKKQIIVITGALSADLNLIFPNLVGEWTIVNKTTGGKKVACKTLAGTGVDTYGSTTQKVYCDGTNVAKSNLEQLSAAANGYVRLACGLILQWGTAITSGAGSVTVNFPIQFPNSALHVFTTCRRTAVPSNTSIGSDSLTTSNVVFYAETAAIRGFDWFAIGY